MADTEPISDKDAILATTHNLGRMTPQPREDLARYACRDAQGIRKNLQIAPSAQNLPGT
ncbi:MAG: hypothetical protein P0Y65_06390 [Candidatus Devosia phytovorans]|uniref:Uncharacterized protein n=1 Tax=Candidatus Devosia phytovorans TaxID=3121372 RepID=A0AAJ5VXT4_9HYPH|nr:hypothetical protein [Devosia sp.]WEK05880.1 MAG: hypothetical protein P0Y65_06390 [Devosia sp.]